jgi:hypothetical protein
MKTRADTKVRQKFLSQQQRVLDELAACENPRDAYRDLLNTFQPVAQPQSSPDRPNSIKPTDHAA